MTRETIHSKIQEAIDALLIAKEHLDTDDLFFEVEQYLEEAKDVTSEVYNEVGRVAEEQEEKLRNSMVKKEIGRAHV